MTEPNPDSDIGPDRDDAVDSLSRLGLSGYEAKVFIALQRTETATARDVSRITDVPRSQVYAAAEGLEERGLIDVQHSSPLQYRAIPLEAARTHLQSRLVDEADRAFSYLESVRTEASPTETRADVWTVHGRETITARLEQLIDEAAHRVVFSTGEPALLEAVLDSLEAAGAAGIEVTVVSADADVIDRVEAATATVRTRSVPGIPDPARAVSAGRVLLVDGDGVLLSVLGEAELPGIRRETAIWSARSGFAAVLAGLLDSWFEHYAGEK